MSKPQALSAVTSAIPASKDNTTEFRVEVHGLGSDERVTLCGSDAALGAWNPDKAVTLTRDATCSLPFSASCGMWRCQVRICVYSCLECLEYNCEGESRIGSIIGISIGSLILLWEVAMSGGGAG